MATFIFEGKSLKGSKIKGKIDADNKDAVISLLRAKGIYPLLIREKNDIDINFNKKISYDNLAIFCRQMNFTLSSGISMLKAILIIKEQIQNKRLEQILNDVYEEIQKGSVLSETLYKYKEIPYLLSAMVEVGEVTGHLDEVMGSMAEYYDKQHRQESQIKNALTYPKFLLGFTLLIVLSLVTFVVPSFVEGILSAGEQLPLPTKIVISISDFIKNNLIILGLLLVGIVVIKKLIIDKNEYIQFKIDKYLVNSKYIARISQQIFTARFARTFGLLVNGGINIIDSLNISGNSVNNRYIKRAIEQSTSSINKGSTIGEALELEVVFPVMLTSMIKIGEETGKLDEILKKTSEYYEIEADFAIKKLMSLIEPILIVVLAFLVGFVVISLAMPMFQIMGTV